MAEALWKEMCAKLAELGGMYPGMDIPEFYPLVKELFAEEEAEIFLALPKGFHPAATVAAGMGRDEAEIGRKLESMADRGLCLAVRKGPSTLYAALPFVPGIFEYQFMRGTETDRDRRLARLIHAYKEAADRIRGPEETAIPVYRVIAVDRAVKAGNRIHTYDQVKAYVENYDPLAVSTCFCRQEGKLVDEAGFCGQPLEVCMQFGPGAQFVIDRKMGRRINREEALEILNRTEEAGLVHATANRQEIDFLCNCCSCHCVILKKALAQPKPGLALNSGFQPQWNAEACTACETCIERCPTEAVSMGDGGVPGVDLDRCIGCGVCATGCPEEAIGLTERVGVRVPPKDQKALREALKHGLADAAA